VIPSVDALHTTGTS